MVSEKNFKIWGVSYGLVGDLIMGLPVLDYFEEKYPDSYKIWVIQKKVAFMAPFFLNHPLIDKIHITEEWDGFGFNDRLLRDECNVKCIIDDWKHDPVDWYNYRDCIDETARVAGVMDFNPAPYIKYPKLCRWFDTGKRETVSSYSKENSLLSSKATNDNIISIFPFATANDTTGIGRSPSVKWWSDMVSIMNKMGHTVYQFGMPSDRRIKNTIQYNTLTFFEQIQIALSTKMSIGTDSGNMWVMGAYSHPAIHLMTQWLPNHTENKFALAPKNINGFDVFAKDGVDNIKHDVVMDTIGGII
ncbi:MAG: glycosyltransferase family 9 protein [Lentisphaerae bacterium]|nr:glycosyltransferase family 9 protein [Lentisphaerota bacterium]